MLVTSHLKRRKESYMVTTAHIPQLEVVVASTCHKSISWVFPLAAHFPIVVLNQCDHILNISNSTHKGIRFQTILPNLGREAHAYLWYIVHNYDNLKEFTAFVQSDAPRHVRSIETRLKRAIMSRFSFVSLTGNVVSSGYKVNMGSLATYCNLYFNFSIPPPKPGAPCRPWNSVTWAHFMVSQNAIYTHRRELYLNLLHIFEDRNASARAFRPTFANTDVIENSHIAGATVMERSWSFIFGCARPLGTTECNYWDTTSQADFENRCHPFSKTLYNSWLVPIPFENSSKLGCKNVHPFNRIPSLYAPIV